MAAELRQDDRALTPIHTQNGVQQHVGAVGAVLPARQLVRRMADAVHAGNEDHAHRHDPRDVLRVVTGAAWQPRRLQPQIRGDRLDGRLDFRASRSPAGRARSA